jgi:hypothetical protein
MSSEYLTSNFDDFTRGIAKTVSDYFHQHKPEKTIAAEDLTVLLYNHIVKKHPIELTGLFVKIEQLNEEAIIGVVKCPALKKPLYFELCYNS